MIYDPQFDDAIIQHADEHEAPQKYYVEYREAPGKRWTRVQLGVQPYNTMMWWVLDYRNKYNAPMYKFQFRMGIAE